MAFITSVLVGVVVALVATAAGGQSALPFASASSLRVEPSTGQVAFIRNGQLLLWDGRGERVVLGRLHPDATVSGFAGEHIELEVWEDAGPFETRVVNVSGKEVLLLTPEDAEIGLGLEATLSLDGTAVWDRHLVDPALRREMKISADVPDRTSVLVSRDLSSGLTTVRILKTDPGSAAPFRPADFVMIGVEDALMTVWGGGVVRTSKGAISWQLPGQASGPPWRVLDVHLRSGLAALADEKGNLRLLRLADGAEQRVWRFAEDPAPLERFLAASLGAEAWQRALARAREKRHSLQTSKPGSPVVASEAGWDARRAYFLASGALVAAFGALPPVILLPDRQEPVAELETVKAALGLPSLTFDPGKGLQQFRRGDGWSAMMFDGNQYREVPLELLPLPR